jgi:hypothetical protein
MHAIPRKKPRRKNPLQQLKLVKRKNKIKVMYRLVQQEDFYRKHRKKENDSFAQPTI